MSVPSLHRLQRRFQPLTQPDTAPCLLQSDGEQSWAILQQINRAFPSYIPHEEGVLVPHRNISIAAIKAASDAYKTT